MRDRAHRRTLGGVLGIFAATALLWACSGSPVDAPSPVILSTPTTVCMGDDDKTPILLDGTMSGAVLTLIPLPLDAGAPPLQYLWTLTGSAYQIVPGKGTLTSDKLTVTMAGDQPLQVALLVTNGSGASAEATTTVSVTVLSDGGCPLGNPGGNPG